MSRRVIEGSASPHLSYAWRVEEGSDEGQLTQEVEDDGEEVAVTGRRGRAFSIQCTISPPCLSSAAHPNKFKKPNISTSIPMKVHLMKTRNMPVKKHTVPLIFCFLAKK